jgi:hypothetical protein
MIYVMNSGSIKHGSEEFHQAVLALNKHASELCPDATYGILWGLDGVLNRICLTVLCDSFSAWQKQNEICNQDAKFLELALPVVEALDGAFERHFYEVVK